MTFKMILAAPLIFALAAPAMAGSAGAVTAESGICRNDQRYDSEARACVPIMLPGSGVLGGLTGAQAAAVGAVVVLGIIAATSGSSTTTN